MNKKLIIGIGVSVLLLVVLGVTYAFFTTTVTGEGADQTVTTGTLSLVYKDGQELMLSSAEPGDKVTKTFTVENTGTLNAAYSINLNRLINTLTNDEIVVYLSCKSYTNYENKTVGGVCEDIESTPVIYTEEEISSVIKENINIGVGITHEYEITIEFIETNNNQNYNQGKTFSSIIQINESSENNTLYARMITDNVVYADNVASPYVTSSTGINFAEISSDTNGKGLYYTTDADETENGKRVYYYRGAVENNYLVFANYCWRIVRTNEDGSVKLRYSGEPVISNGVTNCPQTGEEVSIGTSAFNENVDDNAYIGYMYGETGLTDSDENAYERTHKNTNDSTIKGVIDTWYLENIAQTNYHSMVANTIYCNDRSISDNESYYVSTTDSTYINTKKGYGNNYTLYSGFERFANAVTNHIMGWGVANDVHIPTYKCENKNDEFTLKESNGGNINFGNNALTYPIALLTADEAVYAGGNHHKEDLSASNTTYYLYTPNRYWLMTPSLFNPLSTGSGTSIHVLLTYSINDFNMKSELHGYKVSNIISVLPAISLKSEVKISGGTGVYNNPYVVE